MSPRFSARNARRRSEHRRPIGRNPRTYFPDPITSQSRRQFRKRHDVVGFLIQPDLTGRTRPVDFQFEPFGVDLFGFQLVSVPKLFNRRRRES